MKKIFSFILLLSIFLVSCSNSKYSEEKSLINKISIDNYLDTVVENNISKTYYRSSKSNRCYLFYKTASEYKMIINSSFYSEGMSDFIKTDNLDDYKKLNLNITSEEVIYKINSHILVDAEDELSIILDENGFLDYVKSIYNDEFISLKEEVYEIINYISKNSNMTTFLLLKDHNPNMYYIHGKVSWYDMTKDEKFMHIIEDKLDDTKKKRFSSFMYNICISEFGAPGYLDYTFYLSEDKTKIYPFIVLKYESSLLGSIYFYNMPLMDDIENMAK